MKNGRVVCLNMCCVFLCVCTGAHETRRPNKWAKKPPRDTELPPAPSYGELLHCLLLYTGTLHGAVGSGDSAVHRLTAWGSGQWGSIYTLPHYRVQWVVGLLQYTAALYEAGGSG